MGYIKTQRWIVLIIILSFVVLFSFTSLMAQDKMNFAGQITSTYVDRPVLKFDDTEGHIIFISKWEGVNVSKGDNKFMDGADVSFVTYGDYIKGNGPFWGYAKLSLNEEEVYSKIEGKATTKLSPKGKPITTFKGTLTFTKGTGQFKGIQGTVTYENRMISKRIMVSELEGYYFIKK